MVVASVASVINNTDESTGVTKNINDSIGLTNKISDSTGVWLKRITQLQTEKNLQD